MGTSYSLNKGISICTSPKAEVTQRRCTDGQKHMNRLSTSLVIREMQIKTSMIYHVTPTRMDIIKQVDIQVLVRMWKTWNPHTLLVGRLNWCSYLGKHFASSSEC